MTPKLSDVEGSHCPFSCRFFKQPVKLYTELLCRDTHGNTYQGSKVRVKIVVVVVVTERHKTWKKVRHISARVFVRIRLMRESHLDVLLRGPRRNSTNVDGTADMPGGVARLSSVLQHGESINY